MTTLYVKLNDCRKKCSYQFSCFFSLFFFVETEVAREHELDRLQGSCGMLHKPAIVEN